jgi:hypothetical protein
LRVCLSENGWPPLSLAHEWRAELARWLSSPIAKRYLPALYRKDNCPGHR